MQLHIVTKRIEETKSLLSQMHKSAQSDDNFLNLASNRPDVQR